MGTRKLGIGYGTLKRLADAREQASADTELSSNLEVKNRFGGTCSGSKDGGVSRSVYLWRISGTIGGVSRAGSAPRSWGWCSPCSARLPFGGLMSALKRYSKESDYFFIRCC